jgi:hypothetical protein
VSQKADEVDRRTLIVSRDARFNVGISEREVDRQWGGYTRFA